MLRRVEASINQHLSNAQPICEAQRRLAERPHKQRGDTLTQASLLKALQPRTRRCFAKICSCLLPNWCFARVVMAFCTKTLAGRRIERLKLEKPFRCFRIWLPLWNSLDGELAFAKKKETTMSQMTSLQKAEKQAWKDSVLVATTTVAVRKAQAPVGSGSRTSPVGFAGQHDSKRHVELGMQ